MDLLSAALNESGVTEELEELDASGYDLNGTGLPVTQTNFQGTQYGAVAAPTSTVRYVTPGATFSSPLQHSTATPVRLVQQAPIVRAIQSGGTPVGAGSVRRVIIRQTTPTHGVAQQPRAILTPTAAATLRPQTPQVGGRVVVQGRNSPTVQSVTKQGPVRIIKIATPDQASSSAPQTVPQPKIVKILKTASPGLAQSGAVKRIVVQARNPTPVPNTAVLCSAPGTLGRASPIIRTVHAPTPAATSSVSLHTPVKKTNNVVPKHLNMAGIKVVTEKPEDTVPNRFKQSVRTYSKHSPVRTLGAAVVPTSTVSQSAHVVQPSTNVINIQSVSVTEPKIGPQTDSQPIANKARAATPPSAALFDSIVGRGTARSTTVSTINSTTSSSQNSIPSYDQVIKMEDARLKKITGGDTTSASHTFQADDINSNKQAALEMKRDQASVKPEIKIESKPEKKFSTPVNITVKQEDKTELKQEKTVDSPMFDLGKREIKTEVGQDVKTELQSENKDPSIKSEIKSEIVDMDFPEISANSDWLSVKRELEEQLFKCEALESSENKAQAPLKPEPVSQILPNEVKTEALSEIKQEPYGSIKTEKQLKTEPESQTEMKQEQTVETSRSEIKTNVPVIQDKSVMDGHGVDKPLKGTDDVPGSAGVPGNGAAAEATLNKQESSVSQDSSESGEVGGFGDFGGGDFFQALAQLQDTNKKAEEFENKVKAASDVTEPEGMDPAVTDSPSTEPASTPMSTPTLPTNTALNSTQVVNPAGAFKPIASSTIGTVPNSGSQPFVHTIQNPAQSVSIGLQPVTTGLQAISTGFHPMATVVQPISTGLQSVRGVAMTSPMDASPQITRVISQPGMPVMVSRVTSQAVPRI